MNYVYLLFVLFLWYLSTADLVLFNTKVKNSEDAF